MGRGVARGDARGQWESSPGKDNAKRDILAEGALTKRPRERERKRAQVDR